MFALSLVGILTGAGGSVTQRLQHLAMADRSVAMPGFRLAVGAAALCPVRGPAIGITFQDIGQFAPDARADARRVFGLSDEPGVTALATGGPAERAGVRIGDAVLAIDGVAPVGASGLSRIEGLLTQIDRHDGAAPVLLTVRRRGDVRTLAVTPIAACAVRFQIGEGSDLNAHANGSRIAVTSAVVAYAGSEEQIAAILAHELAHVILRHSERLGPRPDRGKARSAELEADRLSIRLLDLAGYDPDAAIAFWRRMPRRGTGREHPATADRLAAMAIAIRELPRPRQSGTAPRRSDR